MILTGGLNEAVSNLELKAGELLEVLNYVELDGDYHGYASMKGYEVFDGTELASEIPLNDITTGDDTNREARRAAINQVPGSGPINGVHQYGGSVFSVRNAAGNLESGLYESAYTGWKHITTPVTLNPDGKCNWVNGKLAAYPEAGGGTYPPTVPNVRCFFMVDGVSEPISYDGTIVRSISDINLPCDPSAVNKSYPTHVLIFDNRVWLAFPGGHLYYSAIGDVNWSAVDGAGYFPLGDTITNLTVAPGNTIVVHMENSIKIIYVNADVRYDPDYVYRVQEFSQRSGAIPNTAIRLLGRTYYFDDRGLTSMASTEAFGDYGSNSLSKKVHRTYLKNISEVTQALPVRDADQIRLFFKNNQGLCFTFNRQRRIKGASLFQYNTDVLCATEGDSEDRKIEMFFGSSDGFVYKMDSGTSFNGEEIITKMLTSYFHYGSPAVVKRFMKILFEITSEKAVKFLVRCDFDYGSRNSPSNPTQTLEELEQRGGVWGESKWGNFLWGGSSVVQNPPMYVEGIGVNMAVVLRTSDKLSERHVIHNVVTKYSPLSYKM